MTVSLTDLLRAQLAEADAAEAFVAVKADTANSKTDAVRGDDEWSAASADLRAARGAFRALRDQAKTEGTS